MHLFFLCPLPSLPHSLSLSLRIINWKTPVVHVLKYIKMIRYSLCGYWSQRMASLFLSCLLLLRSLKNLPPRKQRKINELTESECTSLFLFPASFNLSFIIMYYCISYYDYIYVSVFVCVCLHMFMSPSVSNLSVNVLSLFWSVHLSQSLPHSIYSYTHTDIHTSCYYYRDSCVCGTIYTVLSSISIINII